MVAAGRSILDESPPPRMRQFAKYLLVGVLNTGLGYAIIFLCMYGIGLSAVLSNVIGYGIGMSISYTLNRGYTFRGTRTDKATVLRFFVVSAIAYLANLGMLLFLIRIAGVHEGLSQLVAGAVYVVTSFLVNKYYVFQNLATDRKAKG
jgi:putative flippase GtrA